MRQRYFFLPENILRVQLHQQQITALFIVACINYFLKTIKKKNAGIFQSGFKTQQNFLIEGGHPPEKPGIIREFFKHGKNQAIFKEKLGKK